MANSKKNSKKNTTATETTKTTVVTETALAKPAENTDVTASFASIDMTELNAAIEGIANRQTKMSDEEKKYALEIVDDWNTGVVQAINDEHEKLNEFLNSVKDITRSYKTLMTNPDFAEPMMKLVEAANLQDKITVINDAIAAAEDAENELQYINNEPLDIDLTLATKLEELDARHKRSKEVLIAQNAANKAAREKDRLISEFNRAFNGNTDIKAAISSLTAFDRKLTRSVQACKTKANQAKLAIAIDDASLREKLSALININLKK